MKDPVGVEFTNGGQPGVRSGRHRTGPCKSKSLSLMFLSLRERLPAPSLRPSVPRLLASDHAGSPKAGRDTSSIHHLGIACARLRTTRSVTLCHRPTYLPPAVVDKIAAAPLPQTYERARAALTECHRLDEYASGRTRGCIKILCSASGRPRA